MCSSLFSSTSHFVFSLKLLIVHFSLGSVYFNSLYLNLCWGCSKTMRPHSKKKMPCTRKSRLVDHRMILLVLYFDSCYQDHVMWQLGRACTIAHTTTPLPIHDCHFAADLTVVASLQQQDRAPFYSTVHLLADGEPC